MARRGKSSHSFLRSKELIAFSEISYDKEGNYIYDKQILKEALTKDESGNFIRNKANIAKVLNKYGILYRMIFNAMNMDQYTYDEVQEALDYLSEYINDLGVSGIVEFHAADQTQNSDHIHFWISTEDRFIYHKIAQEMVSMGYSNREDVYIQKYETNEPIDEEEYVNAEHTSIEERFSCQSPQGITPLEHPTFPSLQQRYELVTNNINDLLHKIHHPQTHQASETLEISEPTSMDCSLPKTETTRNILSRISTLKEVLKGESK